MEEQFQQVTNIINELAASNPYITKEQIAKARSMYNGDMRPIDQIRAELEAYSEEILANGIKREKGKELAAKKPEPSPLPVEETPEIEEQPVQLGEPRVQPIPPVQQEEILDELKVELPGEDKQRALQSMIDDALGEPSTKFDEVHSQTQQQTTSKDKAKVLVKQNEQAPNTSESSSSEAGYGNVTALLSLTIICSIITIIIALLTILAN